MLPKTNEVSVSGSPEFLLFRPENIGMPEQSLTGRFCFVMHFEDTASCVPPRAQV